jgi:hypothetical protein
LVRHFPQRCQRLWLAQQLLDVHFRQTLCFAAKGFLNPFVEAQPLQTIGFGTNITPAPRHQLLQVGDNTVHRIQYQSQELLFGFFATANHTGSDGTVTAQNHDSEPKLLLGQH